MEYYWTKFSKPAFLLLDRYFDGWVNFHSTHKAEILTFKRGESNSSWIQVLSEILIRSHSKDLRLSKVEYVCFWTLLHRWMDGWHRECELLTIHILKPVQDKTKILSCFPPPNRTLGLHNKIAFNPTFLIIRLHIVVPHPYYASLAIRLSAI